MSARIHPTAQVAESATIGDRTQVWLHCQIRENARLGASCILGKNVYIDAGVTIGDRVKIQNNVSVFAGVTIEDGVFLGPHVCFTNDLVPRAINADGTAKGLDDWHVDKTLVRMGAAIGANATVVCGITIGEWAMVGAGSVVTKSVPAYALVYGCPARVMGWVTPKGERAQFDANGRFVGSDGFALQRIRDEGGERVEAG